VRYRLHAYVCGAGCLSVYHGVGTLRFRQIYMSCPNNCAIAVMQEVGSTDVQITNIEEALIDAGGWPHINPAVTKTFPNYDAAVTAAFLTYGGWHR